MRKEIKRFKPKFIKRANDSTTGAGTRGAISNSTRQNPPDIHRLGWAPRPFPRSGMTGEPNSSIMGRMGTGSLSAYTDVDREEFEDQSGMPGKGGNYKFGMSRHYKNKGGGKAMMGTGSGPIGEEVLRKIIRQELVEALGDKSGKKAFAYELMMSQEGDDEIDEEEDELDEFSGATAVAGVSLPLGASTPGKKAKPSWGITARTLNGTAVKPDSSSTRILKIRRMKKSELY